MPISEPRHSLVSLGREVVDDGHRVNLEPLKERGIDTDKVLYFRVTQPAVGGAKPETFWTSDIVEVYRGLRTEMGRKEETAIILVSTLGEIARDSDLMTDMNDDGGHPVRRIADTPFDQSRVLFAMHRYSAVL